jgi:hypothetical protein
MASRLDIALVFAVSATGAVGCTESTRPPRTEDDARSMAPVPACIEPLPARTGTAGTMRNLREDQYWQLVFPAYDTTNHTLANDSLACTGTSVFDDPIFAGGTTNGTPIGIKDGDVLYGSGGDRLRIVFMRTHHWPDGSEAGPIALVRTKEDFAEVYAVGAYRRATTHTTFQAERVGTEYLVTATDDGCVGLPRTTACETKVSLLLPRFGRLVPVASIATERRAYASGSEPGIGGQIEYRLTSSPQYTADGVKLFEQVEATDSAGRVIHKTELERMLVLRDGKMDSSAESIWGRVFPSDSTAPTPAPTATP